MNTKKRKKTRLTLLLEEKKLKEVKVDPKDSFLLDLIRETQKEQAETYDLKRIDEEVLGLVVQF